MGLLSRWDRWNQSVTDWQMDHPEVADRWYDTYARSPRAGVVLALAGVATYAAYHLGGLIAGVALAVVLSIATWRLRAHPGWHRYRRGDRHRPPGAGSVHDEPARTDEVR